jgi:hypothetical protein
MATASQLDDNMIPGQTYTFQLSLSNIIVHPSTSTMQSDLINNAPSFVDTNLQVTAVDTLNIFSNLYNLQFTYSGDGTDVVSDVAAAIISAIKQGSNDDFTLVGAYADTAGNVETPGGILGYITKTVTDTTDKLTKQTSDSLQQILTPVEIAVGIVVILVIALIFTAGKSGGVSGSAEGFSVGG